MRKEELKDIPNIVKIFDNPDTVENGFEELWVHPADFKHIKTVYLGSEVFDHHLLIEWANKILTNHYHTLDIVKYKSQHYFEIKLMTDPGNPEDTRILIKIPLEKLCVSILYSALSFKYFFRFIPFSFEYSLFEPTSLLLSIFLIFVFIVIITCVCTT